MPDMLASAIAYAARGWYVFPCREKPGASFVRDGVTVIPGEKTPYTSRGLNDATRDVDQIKAWWTRWPNAMIGVNAGQSGLFVIDIDRKTVNGLDTFTAWNVNDSAGLHSTTPSGGMHIVFSGKGKSSTNAQTGIDTRGDGGYFVAPPSVISEGKYPGAYTAIDDWNREPGVIPDGLLDNLFLKTTDAVRSLNTTGERKALSSRTKAFLGNGAKVGERNASLFKALADFCGCGYSKEEARTMVLPVATAIGLEAGEFETVLAHAYAKARTPSIPDDVQAKIEAAGKNAAQEISVEEQIVLEDFLIACMITDTTCIGSISDILSFDDLTTLANRFIFKTIIKMHRDGRKIDYVSLTAELGKETDKVSLKHIFALTTKYSVNTEHVTEYAYIIKEKSSFRKLEALLQNKAKYTKGKSLSEAILNIEGDIAEIAISGGARTSSILTGKQATEVTVEFTNKLMTGEIDLLQTGFTRFDNEVGGLFSEELLLCASRPGDGKSAASLSVARHVGLKHQKHVLYFSLEMSLRETIARLICQSTDLIFKNVMLGKLSKAEWKEYQRARDEIDSGKILFDDGFGLSVADIRAKIRRIMDKYPLSLVVVDQLEQVMGYQNEPDYIRYNKIGYEFKNMIKEFDIPMWVNHQLSRAVVDRRLKNHEPQLQDLNQAGEKPATQVWSIVHMRDDDGKIIRSKIAMLKNRNGVKIDFPVVFVGRKFLFSNPVRPEDEIPFTLNTEGGQGDEPSWIGDN